MSMRCGVFILLVCGSLSLSAKGDDFHTEMIRATVKLQHDKSTATGFVLRQPQRGDKPARSVLVTAAHVLEASPDAETTLVYRVAEGEGQYRKETMPLRIRNNGEPIWIKHPEEDIAVLPVQLPEQADLPEISTELLATDDLLREHRIQPGRTVALLGYPHRVEANGAAFPILRTGPIASFPLVPTSLNRRFMLSANTFEGDSGGPIYLSEPARRHGEGEKEGGDVRIILGLMHGQHFLDEEMKLIYGTTKIRHRLGLGIVIQAPLIRETISRLP